MRHRSNKAIEPSHAVAVISLAASTFFASNYRDAKAEEIDNTPKGAINFDIPVNIIDPDLFTPLPRAPLITSDELLKMLRDSPPLPTDHPTDQILQTTSESTSDAREKIKATTKKDGAEDDKNEIDIDWTEVSTVGIFTLTVTAALLTIGKRFLFEIRDYYKDFNDWLNGRSLVSGSVDNFTFRKDGEHIFMELTSLGKFHVNEILEHKQAARQFKRAAQLCTEKESFVSLNYSNAARNILRDCLSYVKGVNLSNDFYRSRFDRELRDAYSGLYREQTKRHMAGYEDGRDLHILIPMVERWKEQVGKGPILKKAKSLERAELSFVSISHDEFLTYFSSPETIERLINDNPRYERRIQILAKAYKHYTEYKNNFEKENLTEVELPNSHPDYQVRYLNASSLFPIIKVYEKMPKNKRESNGSLAI